MGKERYRNKAGDILPGVTTIIGDILAKPALIHWAWNLGMEGKDYRKERDKAADIGTIAHYLISCHLKGEEADINEFSPAALEKATKAFGAFLDFEKQHKLETLLVEKPLISEKLYYGGTPDWYGICDGKPTLLDFKTGKRIYPEFKLQIAAYKYLLQLHGHEVKEQHLLQIDKESGEFHHYQINDLQDAWKMFQLLLKIYPIKKSLWKK